MSETKSKLSIAEVQGICLRNNIPFYTYRLPGSQEMVFGAQLSNDINIFNGFDKHQKGKGFIIAPFSRASWSFPFFIKEDLAFTDYLTDQEAIINLQNTVFNTPERHFTKNDCDHLEYLDELRTLIATLKRESMKKVVFSRTITIPCDSLKMAPILFEQMKQYHHAFLFFVVIPGKCAWMGATPETFLKYDRNGFFTMSLAGTQPATTPKEKIVWSEKDRIEQQIVTDYISQILQPIFTRNLEITGPETVQAGNVYHLCTLFKSDEQLPAEEIDQLISLLHPTPAVCGIPKKRAMQLISEIEKQERRYYAGYLGPIQQNGAFNLFVNLRSMELFNDALKLYVGGGITPASDPENEWEETCTKADTLLNLIRQINYGKTTF
ncbi:isochorismate synthase [Gabonibacter chumensis]|uniref:isochorismate synthase n=1 Tax=Gabonibacter chumensis TaxID=2972474 RepID=UPI0025723BA7|nr:isochorismate synthase [Gabonibacter chumensis]MCR9011149.1 isochorismate synthase [Gabonibacter chumensis]